MTITDAGTSVVVDRVACTGHGICAAIAPGSVALDEWGYPVLLDRGAGQVAGDSTGSTPAELRAAVRLCPTRALRLRTTHHDPRSAS